MREAYVGVAAYAFLSMSAKSSTAFIPSFLTPPNPQRNQSGQPSWPYLFLGRWFKGLAFQKSEK